MIFAWFESTWFLPYTVERMWTWCLWQILVVSLKTPLCESRYLDNERQVYLFYNCQNFFQLVKINISSKREVLWVEPSWIISVIHACTCSFEGSNGWVHTGYLEDTGWASYLILLLTNFQALLWFGFGLKIETLVKWGSFWRLIWWWQLFLFWREVEEAWESLAC